MSEDEAQVQPGAEVVMVPYRPRAAYAGYRVFGSGDGAVLLKPDVARELRSAAELATQEGRVTGGLLYGRGWVDDEGAYLVISGFLEAGPGENSGDRLSANGAADFMLSEADLRLLRQDAARMYSASLELGWWRTLPALGEFGPWDIRAQSELVGPDGVGLLVYGSGIHWGTAYLGPDGHAPDTAGTLVTVPDADPGPTPEQEPAAGPGPELVDITAGEHLTQDRIPLADPVLGVRRTGLTDTAAGLPLRQQVKRRSSRRARRRTAPQARVPPRVRAWAGRSADADSQAWAARTAEADDAPQMPADIQIVVGALAIAIVAAAIIVGFLVHSTIVALIIAAVGLLAIAFTVWVSRRL
ncbi:MAG TPA: hypothetical protein VHF26_13730 [Trebonia sp.]|nr:hypothetical protein [Trebonia sp.]